MALYSRWRCNQEWRSIGAETAYIYIYLPLTLNCTLAYVAILEVGTCGTAMEMELPGGILLVLQGFPCTDTDR